MQDLALLTIAPTADLRAAMTAIDRGRAQIAVLCDADGVLIGVVTDGDIRRALLGGAALDDPVAPFVTRSPLTIGVDDDRNAAIDLMRARRLAEIPIVDRRGVFVGLHGLREIIAIEPRPNLAVLMAGGRGTRLGPITDHLPKPMVPIAGRPLLERLVLQLVGSGIHNIAISVNYRAEDITDHFGDGAEFGCAITYLREDPDRPLGTAGSLGLVPDALGAVEHPVIVMNGDVLTQLPVAALLDHHTAAAAVATIAIKEHGYRVPFGVIDRDAAGRLLGIDEKPLAVWSVNAGVYVLEPSLLDRVPAGRASTIPDLLEDALARDEHISTYSFAEEWIDVGRPGDLDRARGR